MRIGYLFIYIFFVLTCSNTLAQQLETFYVNDVADKRVQCYALINATVVIDASNTIENATLLLRNGKIEKIGTTITLPKDAVIQDMRGLWLYPSFIDIFSTYGLEASKKQSTESDTPQLQPSKKGALGSNDALNSEVDAVEKFTTQPDEAEKLRQAGIGAVVTHYNDGITQGTGALVLTGNAKENAMIIDAKCTSFLSFNKGTSTQNYPESLMGAIALLRQTYLDSEWYKSYGHKEQFNISLQNFETNLAMPQIFDASNNQIVLRADAVAKEFNQRYYIKGDGREYQQVEEIKKRNIALIEPINYPIAYDVEDPLTADNVSIQELKHWELAPFNLSLLSKNDIKFCITSSGLKNKTDFRKNILKAVKAGLPKAEALKALTIIPAQYIKQEANLGTLQQGKIANILVTDGDYFNEKTKLVEHWVAGTAYPILNKNQIDLRGNYRLMLANNETYQLLIDGDRWEPKAMLLIDTLKKEVAFTQHAATISFVVILDNNPKSKAYIRFVGNCHATSWLGTYTDAEGQQHQWTATKTKDYVEKKDTTKQKYLETPGAIWFPFLAFGNTEQPKEEDFLFKNATVWTNEAEGILSQTDVLVANGKIKKIAQNITANNATIIQATGKHLTSGIIDEHSHIAVQGNVNEGTQASSAEVRLYDVLESEDINIYRNLAGGVVAAQILHGSANPIGGQSALIKMRWGVSYRKLTIENAAGFIKFALGENVKQSNWGDKNTIRYPQTRMGVEQVFIDHFTRANQYAVSKKNNINTRRDLELECLHEILNKKRYITCHSYVQSEITMLMRVAENFNFTINTFTHILEGYKVADKMKAHGVGASTFSDWWAYKMEVYDAIPYNASLLQQMGITTAINSDDAEMARRLNQEAAKTIKYGNTTEEEAWKMVTLNPAKLLHLDQKMGSLKVGKDADIVLWSDNPLSIYAICEKTLVDGICYYDKTTNDTKQTINTTERNRIIQKMIAAKKNGEPTQAAVYIPKIYMHCMGEEDH